VLKAAVGANGLTDSALADTPLADGFIAGVDQVSAVARLGLKPVPLGSRVILVSGGTAFLER